MKKHSRSEKYLSLVCLESIITSGFLAVPIMTPFYNSIGLNQEQIALTQAIFTAVMIILNLPAGWLADKISRKWANVIGDLGCGITLLFYSQTQGFVGVVACEIAFGVFISLSQGVDSALIRHFCHKISTNGDQLFKKQNAKVFAMQALNSLILVLLAGPIGAISYRLAIALSSVPTLIGTILSLLIVDDSEKLQSQFKNPFKDIARIAKTSLKNPALRLRIFARSIGREMTHGIIWCFTPMLLFVGVPIEMVSLGWALSYAATWLGAQLAARFVNRLAEWQLFAVPLGLTTLGLTLIGIDLNAVTIWFYLLLGITQGWTGATLMPQIQKHVDPSEQTSVVSFAKVIAQLIYIPAVWAIGLAADWQLNYSALMTLAIFLPAGIIILTKLKRTI